MGFLDRAQVLRVGVLKDMPVMELYGARFSIAVGIARYITSFLIVPVGNNPSGTFMPLYIISHTPGLIFAIPSISWGDRCKYLLRSCFK